MQSRKMEKKVNAKEDRTAVTNGDVNLVNGTSEATLKVQYFTCSYAMC